MKDQTKYEFKELIKGKEDVALGVGLICVKISDDPSQPVGQRYVKRVIHNLTYNKSIEISENAEAFLFIPYGVDIRIQGEFRFLENADSFPEEWFILG